MSSNEFVSLFFYYIVMKAIQVAVGFQSASFTFRHSFSRNLRAISKMQSFGSVRQTVPKFRTIAILLALSATSAQIDGIGEWKDRWQAGQIGFHRNEVHHCLSRFLSTLLNHTSSHRKVPQRILVPLCGKTVDMAYLQFLGHNVVGIDGVRKAADSFIQEQDFSMASSHQTDNFELLNLHSKSGDGQPLRFLVGDFFKATPSLVGTFEAVWDRASLVAVDPILRKDYVAVLTELLDRQGRVLLVGVEHPPFRDGSLGPPYSLGEEEVRRLFAQDFHVRLLQREDRLAAEPKWAEQGCGFFAETTYLLTRRASESAPALD